MEPVGLEPVPMWDTAVTGHGVCHSAAPNVTFPPSLDWTLSETTVYFPGTVMFSKYCQYVNEFT